MNKELIMKIIADLKNEEQTLRTAVINGETPEARSEAQKALDEVKARIADLEKVLADLDEPAPNNNGAGDEGGAGAGDNNRSLNIVAAMQMRNGAGNNNDNADPYDSKEYRTAFMNFACRGVAIPQELRATTTTTDVSAVIPTTLLHEIVKEVKSYGNLYAAVRKLSVQGGVQIPILSLKPEATWIGESTASTAQKVEAKTSVSFNYFGLECKIAQTLLASVTTLEMFQQMFVPLATEALSKALDIAIMNGTGTNQPLGITVDTRVPAGNKITLAPEEFTSWSGWKKKVFAKMKKSYRNGIFYMAQGTFDGYIDGMVDQNGQPIGRVNYGIDGAENYRFGGKVVDTVEDEVIKSYDDAAEGDVVAVFFKPTDYGLNSNLEMKVVKWVDNDTNEVKNKVTLICDGKLIDPNGVIIIKKGKAASA